MTFTDTDITFMQRAIELAQKAEALGEVPIGAVVIHNNQIIGEGWNQPITQHDPTAHAEIMALRNASRTQNNYRLPGTTLYVTLEPCMMCVGAMIHARIERLVFGAYDPKKDFELPTVNHQIQCEGGLLAESCGKLLKDFFQSRR